MNDPNTTPALSGVDLHSLVVPWVVVDAPGVHLEVIDSAGGFVCTPHGDTLGQLIDRAQLIAEAPRLLEKLRRIEEAVTTDHESKEAFITRVRGILGHNDQRVAPATEAGARHARNE